MQPTASRAAIEQQAHRWASAARRALRLIPADVIEVEHTTDASARRVRITASWQDQPLTCSLRLQALIAAHGGRPETLIKGETIEITRQWPTP